MNDSIATWLNSQHRWVQEAAHRLLSKGVLDDSDIADFVGIIKDTIVGGEAPKPDPRTYPAFGVGNAGTKKLRLISVGNIVGIDKLGPRQPLVFPTGNLTVIYGNNGSGKSGYARILKKTCGKAGSPELKSNVFMPEPNDRGCVISFEQAGVEASIKWGANSAPIPELNSIDIFDSASGRPYLDSETTVSFSPPELVLFSDLVGIYKQVEASFTAQIASLPEALPQLPAVYRPTKSGKLFMALKFDTKLAELALLYPWSAEDDMKLTELNARRAVANPTLEATNRRAIKAQLDSIRMKLETARNAITPVNCCEIFELAKAAAVARTAAIEGTAALTQSANLPGVGTSTWKALWDAARCYSTDVAYLEKPYPNIAEAAKCVLCQQDLDELAKQRLVDFEAYVTSVLETSANTAEASIKARINVLPKIPDDESLTTSCQAAGLSDDVTQLLRSAWSDIQRVVSLFNVASLETQPQGIDISECPLVAQLKALSLAAEDAAKMFDSDARTFDGEKLASEILELEGKRWTAAQKDAIDAEIIRLKLIRDITEWNKQTATTGLSKKAGELSAVLITEAYVNRFNSELKKLGASHIQVELIRTRVEQGSVKHKVQLKGQGTKKTTDILSDGEQRIVTLAAFLAAVTAKADNAPFVFDDPISSLDQEYEVKTIDRLISLSADRQVIVFTHRLSLVGLLIEKANPEIVSIRNEIWGAGQPSEVPIFVKNPNGALTDLRDRRLVQARKALAVNGHDTYYPLAKAICSDIRILVERIVELVFLADVIQRHRRDVHTKGKIHNLTKISAADCSLVHKFMSKYSTHEHSQSAEAPVEVPSPDEIEIDLNELTAWHDEFKNRKAS